MFKLKCLFSILSFFSSVMINAQGIKFQKMSGWKDVIAKAKVENKYIFVDCYATWCGPCKSMEREIFSLPVVGEYYNQNFISIKVQFDKTENDDSIARKWYEQADNFQSTYSINSFPTYLYFDSDGKAVHKEIGAHTANNFIQIAKDAQVPEKQYYSILKNYIPGKLDTGELKGLIHIFRYDNKELAGKMVKDYFDRGSKKRWIREDHLKFLIQQNNIKEAGEIAAYILRKKKQQVSSKKRLSLFDAFKNDSLVQEVAFDQLKTLPKNKLRQDENLQLLILFNNAKRFKDVADKFVNSFTIDEALSRDNINLMRSYMKSSNDKSFQFIFTHAKEIDSVMQKLKYTETLLCKIITIELVDLEIKNAKSLSTEPDWNGIAHAIETEYGKQYAERCITTAKPEYHLSAKHWKEYAKSIVWYVDTYTPIEPKSAFYLNNMAYAVFENTNDKSDLERANYWMGIVLQSDTAATSYGTYMATKAEVMYKLGLKEESIDLMEKAIATDKRKNAGGADWYNELYMMKRGEKIWLEKVDGK